MSSAWDNLLSQYRSETVGWSVAGDWYCPLCHLSIGRTLNGIRPFALASEHMRAYHDGGVRLPWTRFRQCTLTVTDVVQWLKTHRWIYYQAPMDTSPRKVYATSKVKTWKRDAGRFEVSVECNQGFEPTLRFRIDAGHLGRLRIPNAEWWHGLTATVQHEHVLDRGTVSCDSRGSLARYGVLDGCTQVTVRIVKTRIAIHQSNGYWLTFDKLSHAVTFAKRQNIRLTANWGNRTKTLVHEYVEKGY